MMSKLIFFRIDIDEDGEEVLTEIEDDDEFERVKEAMAGNI